MAFTFRCLTRQPYCPRWVLIVIRNRNRYRFTILVIFSSWFFFSYQFYMWCWMAFVCSICWTITTCHNNLQFRGGSAAANIELDNYNHLGANDREVIIQGILLTLIIPFAHQLLPSSYSFIIPLHAFLVLLAHCHSRSSGDDVWRTVGAQYM